MSSQRKLEANRRNAQRSTGPRSEAGKAKVARNATRHGFLAQYAVVAPGEEADYQRLCQALFAAFQPSGEIELLLLEQLVIAAWNLRRIAAAESALAEKCGGDPLRFPLEHQQLDRLHRYYAANQRTYLRLTRELTALRAERIRAKAEQVL
jgi:hypothetical protein